MLRVVRIVFIVNMTTPSTVSHGHVTFSTPNFEAILRIECLASDIWALRFRMLGFLSVASVASFTGVAGVGRLDGGNSFEHSLALCPFLCRCVR